MDLDRFDVYWIHNVWDAPKWTKELAKYFEGRDWSELIISSEREVPLGENKLKITKKEIAAALRTSFPIIVTFVVLGIGTVVVIYLIRAFDPSLYVWYDYVLGFICFLAGFCFCYRSPVYWKIGGIEGYPLTERTAYGTGAK